MLVIVSHLVVKR